MNLIGISAHYHDSAAALIRDGRIVAAAQEERFTRKKHDPDFPAHAVRYCLQEAGLTLADIDGVVYYDKPLIKFERLLETYLAYAPSGFVSFVKAMPVWLKDKLYLKQTLKKELAKLGGCKEAAVPPLLFTEHIRRMPLPPSSPARSRKPPCCAWTGSASGRRPRSGWARATS